MFFLLKCVFWLAVVFWLLPWRTQESPAPRASRAEAARTEPAPRAKAAAPRVRAGEALGSLLDEAAESAKTTLAKSARDYCATHAAECLSLIARSAGGSAAEPRADDKRLKSNTK